MTRSKAFLLFCLSFLIGLLVGSAVPVPQLIMLGFLIVGIFFISVFWEYKNLVVFGISILFFLLGIWRFQLADLHFNDNVIKDCAGKEQKVLISGPIDGDSQIGQKSLSFSLKTEKLECKGDSFSVSARILINTSPYPRYQYGDYVEATGFLDIPSDDIDGFNYRNYLKKEKIISVMNWPEIKVTGKGSGNRLMEAIYSFKKSFQEASRKLMPLPQEGILEALIFGDETDIPKELKEKLNISGTRHITAVSGMNITIISSLIFSFALSFGLWRKQAFYLTSCLLFLYVLMVGASASAVRAGIMAFLFLLAQNLGRPASAGRAIVFSAAIMLFHNPFLLVYDLGFQLSFLAIMGIAYLQPIFSLWMKKIPDFRLFPIKSTFASTFSAQFFTLPILIYNFGYFSLVSPLTNILIVPLLAPITILVFLFGLSSLIFPLFARILFWPAWLCLTYIVSVIEYFSEVPFASLSLREIPFALVFFIYLLLGLIAWKLDDRYGKPAFLR